MLLSRREFLRKGLILGAAASTPSMMRTAGQAGRHRGLNPHLLARYVDPLPIPSVARSSETRVSPSDVRIKVPYYRIEMRQFEVKLHRDLPPTLQWGYDSAVPGPTFETQSGQGLLVEWVNRLPGKHFLPIDHTLHGAEGDKPDVRTVVHLHGGRTPPQSDGYPLDWYVPGQSKTYYYPNRQDAATLWYHDHAMGINRLNILAGLFGLFIIRDDFEDSLKLPSGRFEIPLVLYDRMFETDGRLYYPVSARRGAPWIPEFHGDVILVNGKIFPYLEVEPRQYRFRVINVANSQFFSLSLSSGQPFFQIGSDLGLLSAPVSLKRLTVFPAERADLIIDFSRYQGQGILLRNGGTGVLEFRVSSRSTSAGGTLPLTLRSVARTPASAAVKVRRLTLKDYYDYAGNSTMMLLDGKHWDEPVSERPEFGTTEIWALVNPTTDAHPIHLHAVRFQILDRQPFDEFAFNASKSVKFTGPPAPPDPNELGWKDTVRSDPGMVTRIITRFDSYVGRYVWHCHFLEHEDNEMMRPYEIVHG
jgi:spore coat protein A, manganese oxidase